MLMSHASICWTTYIQIFTWSTILTRSAPKGVGHKSTSMSWTVTSEKELTEYAAVVDVYCAKGSKEKGCGELIDEDIVNIVDACWDHQELDDCPDTCAIALRLGLANYHCCLTSLFLVVYY